ncbi:hypothetical protein SAMN05443665_1002272 [Actinomadura meyerae]|uniref:Uncharacterized protein n=1 Tax=Actinomadura meyerae TaxID=240840 RepID=A0A239DF54_9ACTN|nr:hypothetical protein [Actinomadura meyerae]SNS30969.1 hypothetical protein SAMN05443665_1002272 [Actinomadura meyerae]
MTAGGRVAKLSYATRGQARAPPPLNDQPAAAKAVARKPAVLYNAFEYAVELEEFDRNTIDEVK